MPKLPVVKGKDLLKVLSKLGYILDRVHGSHHILRHDNGNKTTIPIHGNSEIPKGTLTAILYDLDITREDLIAFLKKK